MVDYGTDLACVDDIDPTGRVVSGNRLIAEAVARRWTTPLGALIGYPDYGYDVAKHINADMSASDLAAMNFALEAEALKDERVEAATVTSSLAEDGVLTITGSLDAGEGPIRLVLSVSDVSVTLLAPVT